MTRIEEIKKRKPFALWDLLLYGILAAVILILFAVFVFGGSGEAASGIEIVFFDSDETTVYTYEYGAGGKTAEGWESRVEAKEEDGFLLVTVYCDEEKKDYNVIAIDLEKRTAVMQDANCSLRKDCTNTAEISSERSVPIVCLPHRLKVCALGKDAVDILHPSVG